MLKSQANKRPTEHTKWTILVYMAADPVLIGFAVECLKELQATASSDVLVAVQFDAPGREIRRLVFEGTHKNGSINANLRGSTLPAGANMADPEILAAFIRWAYSLPQDMENRRFALVLWGHGPELLLDGYLSASGRARTSFLTPIQLRDALKEAQPKVAPLRKGARMFDIVALDACSGSNLEILCELHGYADFLIASQEDVPDFSFPYRQFLPRFQQLNDVAAICKAIPELYVDAYQDFVRNQLTTMGPVTLASLSVAQVQTVVGPLSNLVTCLLTSAGDPNTRKVVIDARKRARSFVSGLYVDLCDFCQAVNDDPGACAELRQMCEQVISAIRPESGSCVLENSSPSDAHCHGLSIYFPYTDPGLQNTAAAATPLIKGSSTDILIKGSSTDLLNKGSSTDILNKTTVELLQKVRLENIEATEGYYEKLKLSQESKWYRFIVCCWSRWLVEEVKIEAKTKAVAGMLDREYSAQQCALNLLARCQNPVLSSGYELTRPTPAEVPSEHLVSVTKNGH